MASTIAAKAFINTMEKGLDQLDIELDRHALERLYSYYIELKKWSARVNLIARGSSDDQIIENHFLDSLTMLELLPQHGGHLLDIGTGAGFPGLVLNAARPELTVTLVEPRLKRVSFLKHIVRTLGLTDTRVLACRAEDEELLPSVDGYSHITSRAVTDIQGFLSMTVRFATAGVEVICMKGPKWKEELAESEPVIKEFGFHQKALLSKVLPMSGAERTLLVFQREQ